MCGNKVKHNKIVIGYMLYFHCQQMIPDINSKCDILLEILEQMYKEGKSFETKR